MKEGINYSLFEIYFQKAKEAADNGRYREAQNMYLDACEQLLKIAQQTSGEMKKSTIRRADSIKLLADTMKAKADQADAKRAEAAAAAKDQGNTASGKGSGGDTESFWKTEGKTGISFADIAGLDDVKESIRERIILPRQYPEVYKRFRLDAKGGVLLYGPPGTGKTMIAKALASELNADFYSIHASDIVDKYFGESEKHVKSLFETARSKKVAVIFFDEFEALGSERGTDSPVMNRLVPELLSQMDGFSSSDDSDVMILAATNRPWDLDSAFLRPPRLTIKVYVGLPDPPARRFLIGKAFRDVPLSPDVSLESIAARTEGYNCADIDALCASIKQPAVNRTIRSGTGAESFITEEDIKAGLTKIRSSVHQKDIDKIREWEAGLR